MTTISATYSPDDNKLRLYASSRLDSETYARVKAAGFRWAPKQDLFFATWTPGAEDLATELAGEIDDDDSSLVDRAEERADRFEGYAENRMKDAENARRAVDAIADGIPLGQPILVGHHSEKRARRDAEKIDAGMRKAVKMWETSGYWAARAAGAIRAAKYKERPDVRARRIKTLEAEKRKRERNKAEAAKFLKLWSVENLTLEQATAIANFDHGSYRFPLAEYPRPEGASMYEGDMGLWSALDGKIITAAQAAALAIPSKRAIIAYSDRWIAHYENRLAYERAMLADAGGTVADKVGPEKGGACRCWASPRGGWSYIQKVNKVSVTVLDNWGNGGGNFTRTIPFDKLNAIMSAAEVAAARDAGRIAESPDGVGFFLAEPAPEPQGEPETAPAIDAEPEAVENQEGAQAASGPVENQTAEAAVENEPAPVTVENQGPAILAPCVGAATAPTPANDPYQVMRDTLKAGGVKYTVAAQLFLTPIGLARRVAEEADLEPGQRLLEPEAGTGRLLDAAAAAGWSGEAVAVECHPQLAQALLAKYEGRVSVRHADFLECGAELGTFDRIIMNPPFALQDDIRHVRHAMKFLKPGGRLVAIVSAGANFRQDRMAVDFRALVESMGGTIEPLPAGSFKESGTSVNSVLVTIDGR